MGVAQGCVGLGVAEEAADHLQGGATAGEDGGEGVAHVVGMRRSPISASFSREAQKRRISCTGWSRSATSLGKSQAQLGDTPALHWRTMAASSAEIGSRCTWRCLVLAAGFTDIR